MGQGCLALVTICVPSHSASELIRTVYETQSTSLSDRGVFSTAKPNTIIPELSTEFKDGSSHITDGFPW